MNQASLEAVLTALTHPRRRALTAPEQALLDSGRHRIVPHDGRDLHAWTWGGLEPQARHVLLVHGWESRASHWAAFIPALVAAGFKVSAYDGPAHGASAGETTHVVDFGQAVMQVARACGDVDIVIGHSAGSAACLYAFAHGLAVQSSVHISGPGSIRNVLSHAARHAGLTPDLSAMLQRRFELFLEQPLTVMEMDRLKDGFRHPSLLLHDPEDHEVPFTESLLLRAAWADSRLESVSGVGHRRILAEHGVTRAVLGFLGAGSRAARAA